MEHRVKRVKSRRDAFTLAEFLVVIAITMILAGVSFVAAIRYQSRLRRMEMDRTAKEIFLAAQNNLSLVKSGGIMERILADSSDSEEKAGTPVFGDDEEGLYAVLYQPGADAQNANEEIRERLLPFGSMDETVRTDGSYLIVYDPEAGMVRRVWYSDRYVFQGTAAEYADLLAAVQDPEAREHFQGVAIGYYAGDSVTEPNHQPVQPGTLNVKIYNGDILYAEVESRPGESSLKLWIEGVTSGAKGWIDLNTASRDGRVLTIETEGIHYVILDDISMEKGRFANLRAALQSSDGGNDLPLIPGEDIRIYAEAVNGSSTARSQVYQTNSLFQDITRDKVLVSSIRHLENLDYRISAFKPTESAKKLGLTTSLEQPDAYVVSQQKDLSWTQYRYNVHTDIHSRHGTAPCGETQIPVYYMTEATLNGKTEEVWTKTAAGCYAPVEPQFPVIYEGNTHEIQDLLVSSTDGAGGCFGTVKKDLSVNSLTLVCPVITAKSGAGALIGFGEDAEYRNNPQNATLKISVEDVLVQYPMIRSAGEKKAADADAGALIGAFNGKELTVKKSVAANTYRKTVLEASAGDLPAEKESRYEIQSDYGAAGGLIGSVGGSATISGCAAAVYIDAYGYAGGLVANVKTIGVGQTVTIENSYVGGHTSGGKFLIHPTPSEEKFEETAGRYNVVSRKEVAGGLAAVLPEGSKVEHTYVTASVYIYSDAYGKVPDAAAENQNTENQNTENQNTGTQSDPQLQAGFVTMYGDVNAGGENAATVNGKKASEFPYCYSASMVNGAKVENWHEALNTYFDGTSFTGSAKAFPYDKTLAAVYPMPTVIQLVKADPAAKNQILQEAGNEAASQPKNFSRFSRVHLGDWVKVEKTDDNTYYGPLNNGNRLWMDYELDMPQNTGTATNPYIQYLTFSIKGKLSGVTLYYVAAVNCRDLNATHYMVLNNADDLQRWDANGYKTMDNVSRRMECASENGKLRVRIYLDNLAVRSAGYQGLPSLDDPGNTDILTAGEDVVVGACEGLRVPDQSNPADQFACNNSMFERIKKNDDGTYTAYISNGRHLENLNFFSNDEANKNKIVVTKAVQTDNILWQEDSDHEITAKTEAYCKEMTDAYTENKVYGGRITITPHNGFWPVDNQELLSYDGGGYTIVGLNAVMSGDKGASLFVKNNHLELSDLSLKDPVAVSSKGAAAVLLQQAGEFNSGDSDNSYLRINNVRIYGDNMKVSTDGYVYIGGIIAYANLDELEINRVYFYGNHAMIEKTSSSLAGGGLIGKANIRKKFSMDQSMFSGYFRGSSFGEGSGGLIGYLNLSDDMQKTAGNTGQITNCYVAGRNNPYNPDDITNELRGGVNLIGNYCHGGLIGYAHGPLTISNTFSTAGLYDASTGWTGGTGGLIGKYEGNSTLTMNQCYFAGRMDRLLLANGKWSDNTGIMVGSATESVVFNNCVYLSRSENEGKAVVGSSGANSKDGVTACIPGTNSMRLIQHPATSSIVNFAYPYDSSLQNRYPYNNWTVEDVEKEHTVYRGDWVTE